MDIFPDWIGPVTTGGGGGETIYIEVPVGGEHLQGGRIWKDIIVTAKIKMKKKNKILKVVAKLIDKYY